jgi:hypothetical protein
MEFNLKKMNNNDLKMEYSGYFDYELKSHYTFFIIAKCEIGRKRQYLLSTQVQLKVIDINDNIATFLNPQTANQQFYLNVSLEPSKLNNLKNQYHITKLNAIDMDTKRENSIVNYEIDQKLTRLTTIQTEYPLLTTERSLNTKPTVQINIGSITINLNLTINRTSGDLQVKIKIQLIFRLTTIKKIEYPTHFLTLTSPA